MAKLRGEYRSTKEYAPLTLRFTFQLNGKPKRLDAKSNIYVEKNYWKIKHNSSSRDANVRNKQIEINSELQKIEKHILANFCEMKPHQITKKWYLNIIDEYYHPTISENLNEDVKFWIQHRIDNAHLIPNSKGGYGLGSSRISKMKTLLEKFESFSEKDVKIKDFNKKSFDNFIKWMIEENKYSSSYAVKMVIDLKSVFNYALENGVEVSKDFGQIKFKEVKPLDYDMDVIALTEDEIESIQALNLKSEELINARKWLIILCYTGQRAGAFTKKLNPKMFKKVDEGYVIEYTQKKVNKTTTIPVLPEVEELFLRNELPTYMNSQKLNKLFPILGEKAQIDEMTLGKLQEVVEIDGRKVRRTVKKQRPKYQYFKTHIGRRSFASIHYRKVDENSIMEVTGHKKLSTFLDYVNKSSATHLKPFRDLYKDKKKSYLKIINKAN